MLPKNSATAQVEMGEVAGMSLGVPHHRLRKKASNVYAALLTGSSFLRCI